MIRRDLQKNLDLAKELISTLKLPDYDGSMSIPYGYKGLSITEFEERCRVANSLLMSVRKGLREMIDEDFNLKFDKANVEPYDKR